MATVWLQRRGQALIPASAAEAAQVEALPEGAALRCEVKQPRNGKHHRLMWLLFTAVANALNDGPAPSAKPWTAEDVADAVKIATGHAEKRLASGRECRALDVPRGAYVIRPASISYGAMDEAAFRVFAQAACDFIGGELCPYWLEAENAVDVIRLLAEHGVEVTSEAAA